ncbi:hypothetical protein HN419_04695 [Candidatus Woesearchaeota archaeon]|nr:hypothetical protein [Candidatus Woesearchaeota archaeon]MBT3537825.1 hypothetical protein [Candidatus Woesearchaeota archaeon]MBT4697956.1 hypothetical protein [Candidatus Woesearchaeota archaeon]MBT7105494.1 hypothetical protein [Candidatus Woesearchaeota archaeon]MBT7496899.1 hypothetical protein [Candidatus Woesearchaeota archaeon]
MIALQKTTNIRLKSREEVEQLYSSKKSGCFELPLFFNNVFKENFGRVEYDLD